MTTPSIPPPSAVPAKDQAKVVKKKDVTPTSSLVADIPSGSGSRGVIHDEVVSRFIASCPRESLTSMAKIPSDIMVAKCASVLAEVEFYLFFF